MSEEDYDFHKNKKPAKTYVSRSILPEDRPDQIHAHPTAGRRFRIASKVIDTPESHAFAVQHGEHIIRVTDGGREEVIAKFYEDDRGIFTLTIQRFSLKDGKPHKGSFSFQGDEIALFLAFVGNLRLIQFPDEERLNVTDEQLKKLLLSPQQAKLLIADNQELILELARSEVTKSDIVAIGYRKKQLERFRIMLGASTTTEREWQAFFEGNSWVFGYGLTYLFLANLDQRKLEQAVVGNDLWGSGKRADAVMKTRGAVEALCFVEIKKHSTALLKSDRYRPDCWSPSDELGGGVVQAQITVEKAIKRALDKFEPHTASGDPTGEQLFAYQPRSFLVVGSLEEFRTQAGGINIDKYRSFELFRRNIARPEIVTFDELYERAKFIVDCDESDYNGGR